MFLICSKISACSLASSSALWVHKIPMSEHPVKRGVKSDKKATAYSPPWPSRQNFHLKVGVHSKNICGKKAIFSRYRA